MFPDLVLIGIVDHRALSSFGYFLRLQLLEPIVCAGQGPDIADSTWGRNLANKWQKPGRNFGSNWMDGWMDGCKVISFESICKIHTWI